MDANTARRVDPAVQKRRIAHSEAEVAWEWFYGNRPARKRTTGGMPNRRRFTRAGRPYHATKGYRRGAD